MVANFIPLIMQGASDTMGILNKLFGGGGSGYNSDSARAAKWQHNYNLAAMKQAQKYTLDQMAKSYNYNARGVALQNKYNVQNMGKQYNYNLSLQKQAQNYETDMYKQRYQMQVQDLKKAGINPMYGLGTAPALASSGGSVGLPNSGAPTANGGMSPLGSGLADLAGETNSKRLFKLNKLKTAAEIGNLFFNNSALKAQAEKSKAEALTEGQKVLNMQTERIGKQIDNLRNLIETENLPKKLELEIKQMIVNLEETKAKIEENKSQTALNYSTQNNVQSDTAKKNAEKNAIINNNQAATDVEEYFKKHPVLKNIRTWTNAYKSMNGQNIKNNLSPGIPKGLKATSKVMGKVIKAVM